MFLIDQQGKRVRPACEKCRRVSVSFREKALVCEDCRESIMAGAVRSYAEEVGAGVPEALRSIYLPPEFMKSMDDGFFEELRQRLRAVDQTRGRRRAV